MRIARLELYGFKSFPERTVFHFGPGISCVVGPNGSGKSNVVDALRWCIGEQSAKSLRGSDMSDVIFAGSADRRPVGFAEVVLGIAAHDAPFPGEYANLREVEVARRLHRSGTSEYLINQTKVRRRDVVELLMDSGIGNNLYAFIEQGQVDKVIAASPEERRSVIDEAAGIARYKARRAEAQERLEATAAQLDRAADVADEMGRHLAALEQQVWRAAEFRRLRALVRLGELRLALAKHAALAADRRGLRDQLGEARTEEDAARRESLRREEDIAERREELALVQASVAAKRDAVSEIDARSREHQAAAALQAERGRDLLAERDRALLDADGHRARSAEADAEARAGAEEVERLRARDAEEGAATDALARAIGVAGAAVRTAREAVAAGESEVRAALAERLAEEAAIGAAAARVRELQARAEEVEHALARLSAEAEAERSRAAEASVLRSDAEARSAEADAELARADGAWAEAEAAAVEADARRERALAAAAEATAGLRVRVVATAREDERALRALAEEGERRWASVEDAARREVGLARAEAARAGADRIRAAEHAAATELSRAEAARAAAEGEEARARADLGERGVELGRAAGERAAASAELDALRRPGGDAWVRDVLGEVVPLHRAVPADERAAVVRRLGDRAGLPVVRSVEAVLALAAALPADAGVSVVFWPEGAPTPGEGVPERRELGGALAAGGPAVGPGFRVDADGVVSLGAAGVVERAVAREAAASERVVRLDRRLAELESARAAASGRAAAAAVAALAARAEVDAVRERTGRAFDALGDACRADVDSAEEAARERGVGVLDALRAELDRALATARSERAASLLILEEQLAAAAAAPADPHAEEAALARSRRESARVARERAAAERAAAVQARDGAARAEDEASRAAGRLEEDAEGRRREREAIAGAIALAVAAAGSDGADRARRREREGEGRLVAARERAAGLEAVERDVRDRAAAADVARATLVERIASASARAASARRRAEDARGSERTSRETAERHGAAAAGAEAARAAAVVATTALAEERGAAWDALEREKVRAGRLAEGLDGAEKALRDVRARSEDLARRTEGLANDLSALQADLEVLRRGMEDRYQVSLPGLLDRLHARGELVLEVDAEVHEGLSVGGRAVPGVEPVLLRPADLADEAQVAAAVEGLDALRAALAGLGEVNLGAPAEYRDLRRRHAELEAQRADLEASVLGIRTAIAKLNRTCRERFRDTFDRVNEHFQQVYPELVGGGSARLSLTDDEDLLETGVDIWVQPPGKRLQNLQLLSGGEKAMTAIALLIALFRVKPAPFCVLDEVDAPLDEANGARFNEMLKEMARRSQFLVITHNRKTMECADTLYGVTMARPGVSRLVSVDLSAW